MKEMGNVKAQENIIKSFTMADNMMKKYWDMWQLSLGSLSWTQDQLETMTKNHLEQSKVAREASNKVMEDLMKQVEKNQMQMQKMVQQALKMTFENVDIPFYNYCNEIKNKVEEVSKKITLQ